METRGVRALLSPLGQHVASAPFWAMVLFVHPVKVSPQLVLPTSVRILDFRCDVFNHVDVGCECICSPFQDARHGVRASAFEDSESDGETDADFDRGRAAFRRRLDVLWGVERTVSRPGSLGNTSGSHEARVANQDA